MLAKRHVSMLILNSCRRIHVRYNLAHTGLQCSWCMCAVWYWKKKFPTHAAGYTPQPVGLWYTDRTAVNMGSANLTTGQLNLN